MSIRPLRILFQLIALTFQSIWRRFFHSPSLPPPQKILVLGYGAVGDTIFFLPVLERLRASYPQSHLTWIANASPASQELIPASGWVDEVWTVDASDSAQRIPKEVRRKIQNARFDAVIVSQSTPLRPFAPELFSIPLRIGHCRKIEAPHEGWSSIRYAFWRLRQGVIREEFERRLVLNRKIWVQEDSEHTLERNMRLLGSLGVAAMTSVPKPVLPFRSVSLPASQGASRIGLHIGSPRSLYGKIWPAERWAKVVQGLQKSAPVQIVLLGGAEENETAELFQKELGQPVLSQVGKLDLLETFGVIRQCALFLGNDTGLTKAAMALGVPTATVWGPSDRFGWGVYWEVDKHLEIFQELPCSPCVRMGFRREGSGVIHFDSCAHRKCLAELSPEAVLQALLSSYPSLFTAST